MPQTQFFFSFQFPQGASKILLTVQYILEILGKKTAYLILYGQINGQYKYDTCTLIEQITLIHIGDKKIKS